MRDVFLNGVWVGQVPRTGDEARDIAATRDLIRERGLERPVSEVQATFRQAYSFAHAAAFLYARLRRASRDGYAVAPFVMNLSFAIELYTKTLAAIHGVKLRGHRLSALYEQLPPAAREAIVTAETRNEPVPAPLAECLAELDGVFVEWRYAHETGSAKRVDVERAIWTGRVLHDACKASGAT